MNKSEATRSTKVKEGPDTPSTKSNKAHAVRKVFYIAESLLQEGTSELHLERFFHPGKGHATLFITRGDTEILEVLEFAEPRRSWLINNDVCSNGRIYMTTPFDVTFLALHHLRKHCTQRALSLDSIRDEDDTSVVRLLTRIVRPEQLYSVADVKKVGDDMVFFKYNAEKTMAWLAVKTRRVANMLRLGGIHCGHSAQSLNYARSETIAIEDSDQSMDYLRMASDIVGGYVDMELHKELIHYLEIPRELVQAEEKKTAATKRKSLKALSNGDNKKIKIDNDGELENESITATSKLKNNSLLDDSLDNVKSETIESKPTPLKERALSAKEKALAKGAKGTKSIASFFKK